MTALTTQLQAEMNVVRRNGEQLLVTLGIPLLLLGFFSTVDVLPTNEKDPVNFLVPGILALAVMSTSMVSLGIATGFERNYLVLKRLAATPLGTTRLIAAKTLSIAVVEAVQMILLISLGFLLGWSPQQANWLLALCAVVLGTFAFAGIGLFLAGNLRGEVNLAATNGLYLVAHRRHCFSTRQIARCTQCHQSLFAHLSIERCITRCIDVGRRTHHVVMDCACGVGNCCPIIGSKNF
jgi:ABC-2 type transport system permease protein